MNTTAAIFFLVLGQADGMPASYPDAGGLTVIPSHYISQIDCETAGEAARANNQGLSFLSYTCVPGVVNVEAERVRPTGNYFTPSGTSLTEVPVSKPVQVLGPKCDEVCELIEAAL
jgi:hypothetical protein